MVWNKPTDHGSAPDPWGSQQHKPNEAVLSTLISPFINKLQSIRWGVRFLAVQEVSFSWALPWCIFGLLIAVGVWILSGYYIVHPAEEAVILRFGHYQAEAGPGFHWLPRGIEQKFILDVQKIHALNLHQTFLTVATPPLLDTTSATLEPNMVSVEVALQYRVRDPRAFLFDFTEPKAMLQDTLTETLATVISSMTLDEVLTASRTGLNLVVQGQLIRALNAQHLGVEILGVTLQHVQVPTPVRAALHAVNSATQEKATAIQQAETYASEVVPLAQGAAMRSIADAKSYQQDITAKAETDIAQYQALLAVYLAEPGTTRTRMYYDALQSVFTHTHKVLVDEGVHPNLYFPRDESVPLLGAQPAVTENKA